MRAQDSSYFKRVRQQTTNALVAARQFVSTPECLALFHGPGHQEKLRADLMMVSTKGVVVSPARILRDARAVLPVWGPERSDAFVGGDGLLEARLVIHLPGTSSRTYEVTKRRRLYFDIPSEMDRRQISALLYSVEAVDSEYRTASAEHGEPDLVQEVNIDAWMRNADVSLILALADTGWGRYGLLPEVQADLYRHAQTHGERELWEPGDEDQIDDFCLRSDPDKNLRWLQQCRPGIYAAVVLMPYLGDAAPFGAAAEVDSHLVAAARICAPGFDPAVHVHRGTGDVAHDLLGTLPDASLAPAARPNDVGVNRDLSGKVVPLVRRPKGP